MAAGHVAIVGGGIVGVTAAHACLDAGHAVTILDPRGFAGGASAGNAGWIAHTDVMPLASPKAWRHVPGWLSDPLGPLAIRPAYLPRLAPWLARFLLASRPSRIAAGTEALGRLHALALPAWKRRLSGLGLAHHIRRRGTLHVWSGGAGAAGTIAAQRRFGVPLEVLDGAGIRNLEPALGPAITGGVHYPTDASVSDPRVLTEALGEAALGRGATLDRRAVRGIRPAADGITVEPDTGDPLTVDFAVAAAGAWSKPLAAGLGDAIPLDTERGYNVTLPSGRFGLSRPVSFGDQGFVATPLDTGDRVGGAVEFAGLEAAPNFRRVDAMLARLRPLLPDADLSGGQRWMGFRPSIPDSLPVIGPSGADGRVLYAFGHGHYGLTEAAVTAEILAALIAGTTPPLDIAPYRPGRFRRGG